MANRQPGYIDGRRFRVGNVPIWGSVPDVPIPGSMEAYGIFDDFLSCEDLVAAGSTPTDQGVWEYWIQAAATIAQADLVGGQVTITCVGTAEDSGQITLGCLKSARSGGAFVPAAGKHLWFEARAVHTKTGVLNLFIGLIAPVNANILANGAGTPLPNNDMLGFVHRNGEANWSFVGDDGGDEDYLDLSVATDTEYHTFGFYINGITDVTVYLDRNVIAAGHIAAGFIPDGTGLMPAFAIKAGAGNEEKLTIDYVMCVQLR